MLMPPRAACLPMFTPDGKPRRYALRRYAKRCLLLLRASLQQPPPLRCYAAFVVTSRLIFSARHADLPPRGRCYAPLILRQPAFSPMSMPEMLLMLRHFRDDTLIHAAI